MSPHLFPTEKKPSLVKMHLGLTNNTPDAVNCATRPETPSEASCRSQQVEGNGVPSCTGFFEFLAHEILGFHLRGHERKQQETTRIPDLLCLLKNGKYTSTANLERRLQNKNGKSMGFEALSMNFHEVVNDGGFMDLAPRCPPVVETVPIKS